MPKALIVNGHTEDCAASQAQSSGTLYSFYADIFCEGCHDWFDEPYVLPNGTDVAWPSSWSREKANKWRVSHALTRPSAIPAAGPHETPELTNDTSTAETGMLPDTGAASDQDMAPGG